MVVGATGFLFLLTYAWFAKPESLRSQIERNGIHMKRLDGSARGRYSVSHDDRMRLIQLFTEAGCKVRYELEDPISTYELDQPLFWFWHKKQIMTDFYGQSVWFNLDIQ